jgi:catechol 2,3-dioxygenase-like lactoylglutathione lyase family enzyme
MLQEAGVTIIRGPVPRPGGRGRGTAPSLSFYARDPDDNLLEWMIYQDTSAVQP